MDPIFLGIDHGQARIGVAVSDALGMMAHPLETVSNKGTAAIQRITELAAEKGASRIIVGLPRNMDGSEGDSAKSARAFATQLQEATGLPVDLRDERLTTAGAQRLFHDAGVNTRKSRKRIDMAAAQLILQNYLDARQIAQEGE